MLLLCLCVSDEFGYLIRYYSQDLSKYFWMYLCEGDGLVRVDSFPDSCNGTAYLELHARDFRQDPVVIKELDLNGFPWDLASQDLMDIAGLRFTDSSVEYTWRGEGIVFRCIK